MYGGQRPDDPSLTAGWFFMPTIFDRVANSMYLAQEEIFGPVLGLRKFREEEEAIAIANDTDFGLAAGIWPNAVRGSVGTPEEMAKFKVAFKEVMAAKPMVLYESEDFVALASEEVAIRSIFPHEIDTFDPYEGEVRVWQL